MIPIINLSETGSNIKRLRVNKGISVQSLSTIFGFNTPQAIYKWERGDCLPTIDNLVILARTLDVKVDDILAIE